MPKPPEPPKRPLSLHLPFPTLGYVGDVEMTPVDGLEFDSPGRASEAVLALLNAGIPATSSTGQVFAERRFADTWCSATRRYRTPPKRGVRLAAAINKTLKQMPEPSEDDPNVKFRS